MTMRIDDFSARHRHTSLGIADEIVPRWDRERELHEVLGTPVAGGLTLGDLMVGDGLRDQVSPELFNAFHKLMGQKAQSYDDVRQILLERLEDGPASVVGMINKIKGQVGENWFVEQAQALGQNARLAELGNQEGWDVAVQQADGVTRYVQVKMYKDPNGIVEQIRNVEAKLRSPGRITDGNQAVEKIDFAIPVDTVEPVRRRVEELGIDVQLIPMTGSVREAGDVVQSGFDHVGPEALEHLFGQLFGAAVGAAAMHGLIQSFQVYKGAKSATDFLGDTATETGLTVGGIASAMSVEAVLSKLAWIGGVPTYVLVLTTSITTRSILKRILSRRDYVDWLRHQNENLAARLEDGRWTASPELR